MSAMRRDGVRRLLRLPRSHRSIEAEVDAEVQFHLQSRIDDLCGQGVPAPIARTMAEREYGDIEASRRELADATRRLHARQGTREHLMSVYHDLRYATRGFVRRPALAIVTTITLTLGIGANTVMFGVVDQLLLRPPAHVAHASELRQIYVRERDSDPDGGHAVSFSEVTSYAFVRALRERASFADAVATYRRSFILGRGATADPVDVTLTDGTFFSILGVQPATGRFFAPDESRVPAGAPVAVISDRFRRRRLDQSASPIGQTLLIEDVVFTVIGVAPEGFSGVDRETNTDIWVPLGALAAQRLGADWHTSFDADRFHAIARLRPGVSAERAEAEATQVLRGLIRGARDRDTLATAIAGSINGIVTPEGMSAEARTSLWLMGVSAIVLLIAGANVANLGLARAIQRLREIAVRIALGASRGRLVRQLLTESLLLAVVAGVSAAVASIWAGRVVQQLLLPGFAWSDGLISLRVLAFTMAVMLAACVFAGLAPAVYALRTDVNQALKAGSREWTGSRSLLRHGLLIAQAALSVVLLVGAGLFVRSLAKVRSVDVGIDLDRVMIVGMDLARAGFDSTRQRVLLETAVDRLERLPGVAGATLLGASTPSRAGISIKATVPGAVSDREPKNGGPYFSAIDERFLGVMGTKVLRGRPFSAAELRVPSRVALVNQTTADFYWPGADPIGKCLLLGGEHACTEVVGVVQPMMLFRVVNEPSYAQLFLPPLHPAAGNRPRTLVLRASADPRAILAPARTTLQGLAADIPYVSVRSFAELVAPQLRSWRLGAAMCTAFGLIALIIAAVGLYSVMAYWVSQRTYEFGVRMALGAQRRDIQGVVLAEAARTIGVGLTIGLAIAAVAAPRIGDLLYRTSAHDLVVYGVAVVVLALAALAATIVPTIRSTRVSLGTALRTE